MLSSPASPVFHQAVHCGDRLRESKGEVQAIGGVNYKIEGFFECCRKKGLTGTQGVMIREQRSGPHAPQERGGCREKSKFHIYSVKTIDEASRFSRENLEGTPGGRRLSGRNINYL